MSANPAKDLRADWFAFMEGACIGHIQTAPLGETAREWPGRGEDGTSDRNAAKRTAEASASRPGRRA